MQINFQSKLLSAQSSDTSGCNEPAINGFYFQNKLLLQSWVFYSQFIHVCDAIKQNESEVEKNQNFIFWHLQFAYYLSFNLVKTPWRLGYWF